jgi:hypothetical protein
VIDADLGDDERRLVGAESSAANLHAR